MYLVLFETSGNQSYIFSTNKLRDNVGASELTAKATTTWVLEAIKHQGGHEICVFPQSAVRKDLEDSSKNPPIESPQSLGIEVILATSGKTAMLVRDPDRARAIVREVSTRAVREAPGLTLTGVFVPVQPTELHNAFTAAGQELERARWRLPGGAQRFPRLPILVNCSISGLPAETYHENGKEDGPLSAASRLKRSVVESGKHRLNKVLMDDERFARTMNEIDDAVDALDWLAVIHADGNGLGAIFQNFAEYANVLKQPIECRDRFYIHALRSFSMALEESTEAAFRAALDVIPRLEGRAGKKVLMLPLILGGDDLTAQCEGKYAIPFARAFVRAFERETGDQNRYQGIIPAITQAALKRPNLTSCAGVILVKPHFPFFAAYDLAEALLTSAKQVKKTMPEGSASAIDFHVLYDSSSVGLDDIRNRLVVDRCQLYSKPYVVTDMKRLRAEPRLTASSWWEVRHFDDLMQRVGTLAMKDDDGKHRLPQSQMHFLREGLFVGPAEADARLKLLLPRYEKAGLRQLLPNPEEDTLFQSHQAGDSIKGTRITPFLDAMEAMGFLDTALDDSGSRADTRHPRTAGGNHVH